MPDPPRASIRLGSEVQETTGLPGALLLERAAASGLNEIRSASWPTSTRSLEGLGTALVRVSAHEGEGALFEENGVLFEVHLWGSHLTALAAGVDPTGVAAVFERLEAHGVDVDSSESRTLASLFAQAEGRDPSETKLVGFGG